MGTCTISALAKLQHTYTKLFASRHATIVTFHAVFRRTLDFGGFAIRDICFATFAIRDVADDPEKSSSAS